MDRDAAARAIDAFLRALGRNPDNEPELAGTAERVARAWADELLAGYAVDVDAKRNLVWFSETASDRIGRFDPASKRFVEFPAAEADSQIRRIAIDPTRPDRVWWADSRHGTIGYIEVQEGR